MSLRGRLDRLERRWPRALGDMTDAELCAIVAAGTGLTPERVAAMTDAELLAIAGQERHGALARRGPA